MSGSLCLRCALRSVSSSSKAPLSRNFHAAKQLRQNAKPPKGSPRSVEVLQQAPQKLKASDLKPYTPEEKAQLAKVYTPAQMAAIEAGEAAVDLDELVDQGAVREDPYALQYGSDDLSQIAPVIDYPVQAPEENYDPNMRLKTREELTSDMAEWVKNVPRDSTIIDYKRWVDNLRMTVGKEEAERNPISYAAPNIPKGIPALQAGVTKKDSKDGEDAIDPSLKRLMKQTGLDKKAIDMLRFKHLVQHRVVNQTRMGKISSQYDLCIVGNSKGLIGIGEGKSAEIEDAKRQAFYNAIKSMQPIPRYEERTIYGDVRVKMGAVELELMTRPPGSAFSPLPLQSGCDC